MRKILTHLKQLIHFIRLIAKRFFDDSCFPRAAGMSYTSLMSAVPLLAVIVGFGGPFLSEEKIRDFLGELMLPAMQEPIMEAMLQLAENGTRLGILGLPIFLIAVISLMNNIEMNLNHIFRVSMGRKNIQWLTTHLAVIIFAALFLGTSLSLTGDILEEILASVGYSRAYPLFRNKIAPFIFIFAGQMILLTLIPRSRVQLLSAFIASVTGSVLWLVSKSVFALWAGQTMRMSLIYGSIFILPLMLIWLLIIWIIILAMAEFTYIHQHRSYYSTHSAVKKAPGDNLVFSLKLYSLIIAAYRQRQTPPTLAKMADALNMPDPLTEELLAPFLENGIILTVRQKKGDDGFVPSGPFENQRITEILAVLTDVKNPYIDMKRDPLLDSLICDIGQLLGEKSVASYLAAPAEADAGADSGAGAESDTESLAGAETDAGSDE
ncbi:MAG: YihY/virulence factor BrkB family protein [Spirochaetales bacterium]|nr:YihY/virulence factor BrkB family protein [Spirochaetales bacterium]